MSRGAVALPDHRRKGPARGHRDHADRAGGIGRPARWSPTRPRRTAWARNGPRRTRSVQGTSGRSPRSSSRSRGDGRSSAPDYEGPQSQYGAGWLRGPRCARLDQGGQERSRRPGLANSPVGVWGYSGGALATAWAAEVQPAYAPEIEITGVAAGGVPPDFEAVARTIDGGPFSGLGLAVETGLGARVSRDGRCTRSSMRRGRIWYEISDKCVSDSAREGQFKRMDDLTREGIAISSLPRIKNVLLENHLGKSTPAMADVHLPRNLRRADPDRGRGRPRGRVLPRGGRRCSTTAIRRASTCRSLPPARWPRSAYLEDRFNGQPVPTDLRPR